MVNLPSGNSTYPNEHHSYPGGGNQFAAGVPSYISQPQQSYYPAPSPSYAEYNSTVITQQEIYTGIISHQLRQSDQISQPEFQPSFEPCTPAHVHHHHNKHNSPVTMEYVRVTSQ